MLSQSLYIYSRFGMVARKVQNSLFFFFKESAEGNQLRLWCLGISFLYMKQTCFFFEEGISRMRVQQIIIYQQACSPQRGLHPLGTPCLKRDILFRKATEQPLHFCSCHFACFFYLYCILALLIFICIVYIVCACSCLSYGEKIKSEKKYIYKL